MKVNWTPNAGTFSPTGTLDGGNYQKKCILPENVIPFQIKDVDDCLSKFLKDILLRI